MANMKTLTDVIVITHRSMCVSCQGLYENMCLICINVLNLWTYVWPSTS